MATFSGGPGDDQYFGMRYGGKAGKRLHCRPFGRAVDFDCQYRDGVKRQQPRTAVSAGGRGIDLGLAISHRLCQMIGGEISLRSEPEQGSIFTIRMPLAAGQETVA